MPSNIIKIDLIGCDYDETITKVDTISLLASLKKDKRDWNCFVEKYIKDYNEIKQDAKIKFKKSISDENNWDKKVIHLNSYIEAFKKVEQNSINRINEAKILKGIDKQSIYNLGLSVPLRLGAKENLDSFLNFNTHLFNLFEYNNQFNILSVNWSKLLINSTLSSIINDKNNRKIKIYSNDLEMDKNNTNLTTGNIIGNLSTGVDKLNLWKKLISSTNKSNPTTLYFGDSLNDLPCLLHSTYGIIIGDPVNKNILEVCDLLKVEIVYGLPNPNFTHKGKALYYIPDWPINI